MTSEALELDLSSIGSTARAPTEGETQGYSIVFSLEVEEKKAHVGDSKVNNSGNGTHTQPLLVHHRIQFSIYRTSVWW